MELKLKRPIIFFDIESTGVDPGKDHIVEISLIKVHPNGDEEVKTRRINPGVPIPAASTAIHGITDEDVKDCPTFAQIGRSLAEFIQGADLAGYNSNKFDIPILVEEFMRAGIEIDLHGKRFVDVQNIFHKMEQRTLAAAYKFYCGSEIENAHSAEADIRATYEVLKAQLDRYPDALENDVEFLADFSRMSRNVDFAGRIALNEHDVPVFNFGKHKGRPVAEVFASEPSYYSWMMNGDFPRETKQVLTRLRLEAQTTVRAKK
ncbi:MAG: 3'-5' exonuclease [Rikenella sp.]|nr:3'-5' exonuclease [Rikenella sp.]